MDSMSSMDMQPAPVKRNGLVVAILIILVIAIVGIFLATSSDKNAEDEVSNMETPASVSESTNTNLNADYSQIDQMDQNLDSVPVDGASDAL